MHFRTQPVIAVTGVSSGSHSGSIGCSSNCAIFKGAFDLLDELPGKGSSVTISDAHETPAERGCRAKRAGESLLWPRLRWVGESARLSLGLDSAVPWSCVKNLMNWTVPTIAENQRVAAILTIIAALTTLAVVSTPAAIGCLWAAR